MRNWALHTVPASYMIFVHFWLLVDISPQKHNVIIRGVVTQLNILCNCTCVCIQLILSLDDKLHYYVKSECLSKWCDWLHLPTDKENIHTLMITQSAVHCKWQYTVNREGFAGLNFCVFHNFQEYHESFSMNISASL